MEKEGKKCTGSTKTGKHCKRVCVTDSDYCKLHRKQEEQNRRAEVETSKGGNILNEDCPACLTQTSEKLYLLSCKRHRMHLSCAEQLISLECPLCLSIVTNFPPTVVQKIIRNDTSYKNKLEAEDIQEFIGNDIGLQPPSLYLHPSIRAEVAAAVFFLKQSGVPSMYIPRKIKVHIHKDSLIPPHGTYFYAIIGHAVDKMEADMQSSGALSGIDESSDSNETSEYDYSSEENPFPNLVVDSEAVFDISNIAI